MSAVLVPQPRPATTAGVAPASIASATPGATTSAPARPIPPGSSGSSGSPGSIDAEANAPGSPGPSDVDAGSVAHLPALFEPDGSNPFIARAAALRARFAVDGAARDRAGGRPLEQIRQLKQQRLLALLLPRDLGGEGEPWSTALRITRLLSQVDASVGHLYGYHYVSLVGLALRGVPERTEPLWRRSANQQWFWGNTVNSFSRSLFGKRDGEDFVLDGHRPFTSGSHVADYLSIAWEDAVSGERHAAAIPVDREGVVIEDDWDGIGQRQTGSGRVTYHGVRVHGSEVLGLPAPLDPTRAPAEPWRTLTPLLQQSVLLNVFVGSAQGSLQVGRDEWVRRNQGSDPRTGGGGGGGEPDGDASRRLGALWTRTQAATALADRALRALDAIAARGTALTAEERGEAAVAIAAANALAGSVGLVAGSELFELLGEPAADRDAGLDRFWRNVRIHTLHNPAEYKTRNVGRHFLSGIPPVPGTFQ